MNKKWCPRCSHPNPYETIAPRMCAKCGTDMLAAFVPTATSVSRPAATYAAPPEQATASVPLRRPAPRYQPDQSNERGGPVDPSDYFNPAEVNARANSVASALAGIFSFSVESGTTVKAGQYLTPAQAQAESAPKKRSRRKS